MKALLAGILVLAIIALALAAKRPKIAAAVATGVIVGVVASAAGAPAEGAPTAGAPAARAPEVVHGGGAPSKTATDKTAAPQKQTEKQAIQAAETKTLDLKEVIRSVDLPAGGHALPYKRRTHSRNVLHRGQRKLYLSELDFLTQHLPAADQKAVVVYAGAAPGHHFPHLASKFPNITWHLYDPAKFAISTAGNITVHSAFFTDDVAEAWKSRCDFFISDIRVGKDGLEEDAEGLSKEFEAQVLKDLAAQAKWAHQIKPKASMLKFRVPYTMSKIKYLSGTIRVQAFPGQSSTESRLITEGKGTADYSLAEYEQWYAYHNVVVREHQKYAHSIISPGLDHCADCALEVLIQRDYLQKSLGRAPTDAEIGQAVTALTEALKKSGLKIFGLHEKNVPARPHRTDRT